jgi:hypothetical protein
MDRASVPRQTAKQITGHKTDAVYNRYRIVNEQDIREGLKMVFQAQSSHILAETETAPPLSY